MNAFISIILSYCIAVYFLWLDYLNDKKGIDKNSSETDTKKIKGKKRDNWLKTGALTVVLIVSLYFVCDEKKSTAESFRAQLNSYKTIDTIKDAGRQLNIIVDQLKTKTDSVYGNLDSMNQNIIGKYSEFQLALQGMEGDVKRQFLSTQSNLSRINESTNENFKLSQSNFSDIILQSKRSQYPLPDQIESKFIFSWSVKGVNGEFDSTIRRLNKKATDKEFAPMLHYRIDKDFNSYSFLYLSHKHISLILEKNNHRVEYEAILWPETIKSGFDEFYPGDEFKNYKNSTYTYDNQSKTISLDANQCPFYLKQSTSATISLTDLDGANVQLRINQAPSRLHHFLDVENSPDYIFGYSQYNANDGVKRINYEVVNFKMTLLNGKYSFNASDTARTTSMFLLGKLQIPPSH